MSILKNKQLVVRYFLFLFILWAVSFGAVYVTHAAIFTNPIAYGTLQDFLIAVLRAVVIILFPIIVLMLVYCGFLFITAQGNSGKLQEARKLFLWTLIGGAIILGAEALALAISATVEEIQNGTVYEQVPAHIAYALEHEK